MVMQSWKKLVFSWEYEEKNRSCNYKFTRNTLKSTCIHFLLISFPQHIVAVVAIQKIKTWFRLNIMIGLIMDIIEQWTKNMRESVNIFKSINLRKKMWITLGPMLNRNRSMRDTYRKKSPVLVTERGWRVRSEMC